VRDGIVAGALPPSSATASWDAAVDDGREVIAASDGVRIVGCRANKPAAGPRTMKIPSRAQQSTDCRSDKLSISSVGGIFHFREEGDGLL
jgi:hypothetical protein